MHKFHKEEIKKKLSGQFSHLYPIYKELCDTCLKDLDVNIILKTSYILVDSREGLLASIYWNKNSLEIAFPSLELKELRDSDRIMDASHLNYPGLTNMIKLSDTTEIDSFVVGIFNELYKNPIKFN